VTLPEGERREPDSLDRLRRIKRAAAEAAKSSPDYDYHPLVVIVGREGGAFSSYNIGNQELVDLLLYYADKLARAQVRP
jgi:hypothetical protein